jgi:hypothetical protein
MTNTESTDRHPTYSPLHSTAVVIYATLALLAVAIPQSVTNWLREMKGSVVQENLLLGAEALQSVSEKVGVAEPYRRCREFFLTTTGQDGK